MAWHNDQVSREETTKILSLAQDSLGVEGDFVELGCYRGDTSLLLAELLRSYNRTHTPHPAKKLWIYDSFEGLPAKTTEDTSTIGENFQKGELFTTKREVKARFLRAGLPVPIITKAWFEDLTAADIPEKIAFAFLDGDLYSSIRTSFHLIEKALSPGAIIVVHDYVNPALPGVARAVDEWCTAHHIEVNVYHSMAIIRM